MSHAFEESEKLIMSELLEFQVLKLSTDLKKFKNLMLGQNVVFSILEKLGMITSHIFVECTAPTACSIILRGASKGCS